MQKHYTASDVRIARTWQRVTNVHVDVKFISLHSYTSLLYRIAKLAHELLCQTYFDEAVHAAIGCKIETASESKKSR